MVKFAEFRRVLTASRDSCHSRRSRVSIKRALFCHLLQLQQINANGTLPSLEFADEMATKGSKRPTRAALTGLRKSGFDVVASKPDSGGSGRYCISTKTAAVN
jgi:hypothetical protein